jgi:hypothetical protein
LRNADRTTPATLLVGIAVAYAFLFAVPASSYYVDEPRYALMLAPVVVLLGCRYLDSPTRQWVALVVAVVLAWSTVATTIDFAHDTPARLDLGRPALPPLRNALDRLHVDRVFADYWFAYPLTFVTDERIVASPIESVRSTALHERVAAAPKSTYVVFRDSAQDRALGAVLRDRRVRYRRVTVAHFAVYLLPTRLVPAALGRGYASP